MRQVRCTAWRTPLTSKEPDGRQRETSPTASSPAPKRNRLAVGADARRQAWEWAVANMGADGALPTGKVIADQFGRHERWGRLVKNAGAAGEFAGPAGVWSSLRFAVAASRDIGTSPIRSSGRRLARA